MYILRRQGICDHTNKDGCLVDELNIRKTKTVEILCSFPKFSENCRIYEFRHIICLSLAKIGEQQERNLSHVSLSHVTTIMLA